jgi:hypothetical protein
VQPVVVGIRSRIGQNLGRLVHGARAHRVS